MKTRIRNALFLCACSAALNAPAQAPATSSQPVAKPSTPAKSNAGVVNEWLRQQSPAWTAWDLGAQYRVRYELFENAGPAFPALDFQSGAANDNSYLWQREKVHIGYNADWFSAYVEGRDSSSIGDNDPKNPGQDRFDLQQLYFTAGNPKKFPLTAKIGRQELIYGDERLLGAADWNNTGRVFDAAKLRWEQRGFWVDAFAARVVLADDTKFNEADTHDWLFGLYGSTKTLVPIQESQLYFLSRNTGVGSPTKPRDIYSAGFRAKSLAGKLKGWDYTAEAVHQFGSISQAAERREQNATALAVAGGYTWNQVFASPRLGMEYDYSTGDSDPNDGESETLDNLFPTNHKHYGLMDLVGWRNMHDVRFSLSGKPAKGLSVAIDYHLFWLADTHDYFYPQSGSGRNGNGFGRNGYDSFAGSELDLDVTYTITPWAGIRGGYGHFFTGGYVDQSKEAFGGATGADWLFAQLTLSF